MIVICHHLVMYFWIARLSHKCEADKPKLLKYTLQDVTMRTQRFIVQIFLRLKGDLHTTHIHLLTMTQLFFIFGK